MEDAMFDDQWYIGDIVPDYWESEDDEDDD